jgi:hypothetical protein
MIVAVSAIVFFRMSGPPFSVAVLLADHRARVRRRPEAYRTFLVERPKAGSAVRLDPTNPPTG